jgi:arabinofuranosyltransferase
LESEDVTRAQRSIGRGLQGLGASELAARGALLAACAGLLIAVAARAWVCDDAYISFRVVDNLLNGHGLRWNVDERVEVYTHPLWLLLHVPFYALTGNVYLTTIALGVICTALAVGVAARAHPGRPWVTALVLVAPLALSRAFVEFGTSGLENPLSYLLFACFGWLLVRRGQAPPGLAVGLVVGLALLNRLDLLFFYAVPLAWLLWSRGPRVRWAGLVAGLSPVALWEAFRLLYYGFTFPNTKYAKLDAGPPLAEYLERGLLYAADLALVDPASLVLLAGGVGVGLLGAMWRRGPGSPAAARAALAVGCLCYAAYVVYVGGDFMGGRFWALPVFIGAWCLHGAVVSVERRWPIVAVPAALVIAVALEPSPEERERIRGWTGVGNEREFYRAATALFKPDGGLRTQVLDSAHAQHGLMLRVGLRKSDVFDHGVVGMLGYHAGPHVRIVDRMGLADPLLARLPAAKRKASWRVGHLKRRVPAGYLHARATGSTDRMDPGLAAYYAQLRLVTAGPLLDRARLRAIVGLARGEYDDLLGPRAVRP